jgi:hypothetical protein
MFRPGAGGGLDRLEGAIQVATELIGAEPQLEAVAVAVDRHHVTLARDLQSQLRPALDLLADQEERRSVSRAREEIEDRRCPFWMGTVIERQRDPAELGREHSRNAELLGRARQDGSEGVTKHAEMMALTLWQCGPT